ncbi:MAG: response regulator transcription factor [Acidobacteria bacterium]|nr:response regulator transcription factor [Acidobacteriota bacterium]
MGTGVTAAAEEKIRIVVVEDYELFRKGLCSLLSGRKDFEIAGDSGDWEQALAMIRNEQPNIVIVGLASGDSEKMDFLPQITDAAEDSKILVLSKAEDGDFHHKAVRLGASGVVSHDKSADMLVKAIVCVNRGEVWLDRFTTASLLRELSPRNRNEKQDPEERKIASLTEREREVIRQIGKGLKNRQIAEALFISEITVHHHLTSIYSKLEVADRFELLIFAYRNRLAEIPR